MPILPKAVLNLIDALHTLPGVGSRSAERYAYYLLKGSPNSAKKLARSLEDLHEGVDYCQKTFALIAKGEKLSPLYTDQNRDRTTVLVVADPFDVVTIESTGKYQGTYHVLGGLLSPIDGISADQLTVRQLVERVKIDKVKEIILATNASVEGESTALLIKRELSGNKLKITRLAQGLPIGVDIEYADQITLGKALDGRREIDEN